MRMHTREFLQTLHMRDMLGIVVLFTNNFMRHQDTNPHFTAEETDNRKIEGKKKKYRVRGSFISELATNQPSDSLDLLSWVK